MNMCWPHCRAASALHCVRLTDSSPTAAGFGTSNGSSTIEEDALDEEALVLGKLARLHARFHSSVDTHAAAFSGLLRQDIAGSIGIPPEQVTSVRVAASGWVSIDYETETISKLSQTPAFDLCALMHDSCVPDTDILKHVDDSAGCAVWASAQRPFVTLGPASRRHLQGGLAPPLPIPWLISTPETISETLPEPGNPLTNSAGTNVQSSSCDAVAGGEAIQVSIRLISADPSLIARVLRALSEPPPPATLLPGGVNTTAQSTAPFVEEGLRASGEQVTVCDDPVWDVTLAPAPSLAPPPRRHHRVRCQAL